MSGSRASPLTGSVAAVSCGVIKGTPLLDLDYREDSSAEVDANVVMTGDGGLVELQSTAERTPLSRAHLNTCWSWPRTGSASCGGFSSRRSQRAPDPAGSVRAAEDGAEPPNRHAAKSSRQRLTYGAWSAMRLLLATHNAHKLREFERMLSAPVAVELDALPGDFELPPEDGETFAENALGKARAAAAGLGRVCIADDSGIAAAALDGAPGVRSARFAGEQASDEENLAKLLREAPAGSALEYVCVIAYVDPGEGVERLFEGRCAGVLAAEPRGEGGFGYDPAFVPSASSTLPAGATMAELSDEQKDAISHRGLALGELLGWLTAG